MPYITREDGERFIIPSYRDVLSAKKAGLLKREILLLSSNYGEYIALQKKGTARYEVAFSPEPGSLLGETVWHYFKRPSDLIYCEAIPNTKEAILVIVKSGSVYLDGNFPVDSIPEELVIFKTQQNNFEIYLYGDVPISRTPETGKFSFDSASVKSFTVLDKPAFAVLPIIKAFQLQLVNVVLKEQGIGEFPIKPVLSLVVLLGLIWMAWSYLTSEKPIIQVQEFVAPPPMPYKGYIDTLTTPNPADEIEKIASTIAKFFTIPGWQLQALTYNPADGIIKTSVSTLGARTAILLDWALKNGASVDITSSGYTVAIRSLNRNRPSPTSIYNLEYVIAQLIDRLSYVNPGQTLTLGNYVNKGQYTETELTINVSDASLQTFILIGQQMKMLPIALSKVNLSVAGGNLTGTIVVKALGN